MHILDLTPRALTGEICDNNNGRDNNDIEMIKMMIMPTIVGWGYNDYTNVNVMMMMKTITTI